MSAVNEPVTPSKPALIETSGTPSKQRTDLISAADKPQDLKKLITRHLKKGDPFILRELIEPLSTAQHTALWASLLAICTDSVVDVSEDADNVHSVAVVASVYIECGIQCDELVTTVKLIHDHLLEFSEKDSYTQNYCCTVLEQYWSKGLPDKDFLAVYVPPYLLARLGCSMGKLKDVSRLNKVSAMLKLIDLQDPSSASLVNLLCSSVTNTLFFRNNDGLNFLSTVMMLDRELLENMDTALKSVLADYNDTQLAQAGSLYVRLWEALADRPALRVVYTQCVQGLVDAAIHCHRSGPYKAAPQIQKVLSVLHQYKKNEPALEQLLHDLYKPVLYANLHVANGDVRANACTLLLSVFPLVEPSWSKVQFEGSLEEQCTIIKELLMDGCEQVRVCAVKGTAKILDSLWEVLPRSQGRELLVLLCTELTLDMSSTDVCVAALQGIQLLLNNPLLHVSLNKLLPTLENHIYHPASTVRAAFVSLLLTVNQTNSIKFWHIVKAEDLLAALTTSKPGVVRRRLVSLLAPSYFPSSQPLSTQLLVALSMLRGHPTIHRVFYSEIYQHVDMSATLKFVVMVLKVVYACVEEGSIELEDENASRLEVSDLELMNKLLETCALLVQASAKDVASNAKAAIILCSKTVDILPVLLEHFTNPLARDALVTLLSHLPKEGLQSLNKMCVKLCKEETAVTAAYLALIRSGRGGLVVEYLTESIARRLEHIGGRKKARLSGSYMANSNKSGGGLEALTELLEEVDELLKCDLTHLTETLCNAMDVLETSSNKVLSLRLDSVKFLAQCVAMYLRLGNVQQDAEDGACGGIAKWVYDMIKDRPSSDNVRSSLIKEVYPMLVELTQLSPYSAPLLSSLLLVSSSLTSSELTLCRVSVCKLLVIAGNLYANNKAKDIELQPLLIKVLTEVSKECLLNRTVTVKSLSDIQALTIEVGIQIEKHLALQLAEHPWQSCMSKVALVLQTAILQQDSSLEELREPQDTDYDTFTQCMLSSVRLSESLYKHLVPEVTALEGTERWCVLAEKKG